MDLISKKEVENKILNFGGFNCWDDKSSLMCEISSAPSAFEGMTNGEVIQALFPNAFYNGGKLFMHIINVNNIGEICIPWRWWNAPYKAESEGSNDKNHS